MDFSNLIVRNQTPQPKIEAYEVRMARFEDQVKAASNEQLATWSEDFNIGDLRRAAIDEMFVRGLLERKCNPQREW